MSRNYLAVCSRHNLHRAIHAAALRQSRFLHGKFFFLFTSCHYESRYYHRSLNKRNSDVVQNSTVTERAKNFHSVQYLLIHGTADGELCWAILKISPFVFTKNKNIWLTLMLCFAIELLRSNQPDSPPQNFLLLLEATNWGQHYFTLN